MNKVIFRVQGPSPTHRNQVLAWVAENDPTRFRTRTVRPEKGRGRKDRPRGSNRNCER